MICAVDVREAVARDCGRQRQENDGSSATSREEFGIFEAPRMQLWICAREEPNYAVASVHRHEGHPARIMPELGRADELTRDVDVNWIVASGYPFAEGRVAEVGWTSHSYNRNIIRVLLTPGNGGGVGGKVGPNRADLRGAVEHDHWTAARHHGGAAVVASGGQRIRQPFPADPVPADC